MPLSSNVFKDNARLNQTLVSHPAHVVIGDRGEHVGLIQFALQEIDGLVIDSFEIETQTYGQSTAAAVLAYKKARAIINPAYQSNPDNIVGKMTIDSLDKDMLSLEHVPLSLTRKPCTRPPSGSPQEPPITEADILQRLR
jgi:hypothetical protein